MIKLINLISEDAQSDIQKASEARSIISYLDNLINSYTKNNNVIKYFPDYNVIKIKYKDIEIIFDGRPSFYKPSNQAAAFYPKSKEIRVNKSKIDFKNKRLTVEYPMVDLFHELIHYLDQRTYKGNFIDAASRIKKGTQEKGVGYYYNSPEEFNAHYFEYVYPTVIQALKYEPQLVLKGTAQDFYKSMMNLDTIKYWMPNLQDKYKRKAAKRIAAIYQFFKENPKDLIKLSSVNIDNLEQEQMKYGFLQRLKDLVTKPI